MEAEFDTTEKTNSPAAWSKKGRIGGTLRDLEQMFAG